MKYEIMKGSEKDFDDAPEWAMQVDKCIETGHLFYTENIMGSQSGTDKCKWSNESEVRPLNFSANYEDEGFETIAQRRPITEPVVNQQLTTEWDGEGLPPAGSTFDMRLKPNGLWLETKLIAAGQEQIIYFREGMEFSGHKNNYEFRPIRSPEDVARDEAVKSMCDHWNLRTDLMCESIYDAIAAGKIPGVKLE